MNFVLTHSKRGRKRERTMRKWGDFFFEKMKSKWGRCDYRCVTNEWQIILTLICQLPITHHTLILSYYSNLVVLCRKKTSLWIQSQAKCCAAIGHRAKNMQSMLTHWLIWDLAEFWGKCTIFFLRTQRHKHIDTFSWFGEQFGGMSIGEISAIHGSQEKVSFKVFLPGSEAFHKYRKTD